MTFMFKGQRRYLERLSTDELHTEALALGLDAPFGLDRVLLIDEMLDAGFTMEMETEEPSLRDAPFEEEPVPLPQRYNMTYIETVVRDPLWVFLYWELRESEKTLLESAPGFGGYLLRILRVNEKAKLKEEGAAIEDAGTAAGAPLAEDANTTGGAYPAETEVLRVPINLSDSGWYLGRNEDNGKQAYIAQLCVLKDKKPRLLAASPRFGSHYTEERLAAIPGRVINPVETEKAGVKNALQNTDLKGCPFAPRCSLAKKECASDIPPLRRTDGGLIRCFMTKGAADETP